MPIQANAHTHRMDTKVHAFGPTNTHTFYIRILNLNRVYTSTQTWYIREYG